MDFKKEYVNKFGSLDYKQLKKDFNSIIDKDDYLFYNYKNYGLQKVISILENRIFNHNCSNYDLKTLNFINRNRKQLDIVLYII